MVRNLVNRDSVAVAGVVIGVTSLLCGWLTLKPNRLVPGTSLHLWESAGWNAAAIIIMLWLICLALSLVVKGKRRAISLGVAANLIVISALGLAGTDAGKLIEGQASFARVSLGAGFWLTLAGAYFVVYAARQELGASHIWRNVVSWSGVAVAIAFLATGQLDNLSILQEFAGYEARFFQELKQHLLLVSTSVAVGGLIGIPLGIWATRSKRAERPIFFVTNITQTIPSLALFGLLIAPLSALSFAFPALREFGVRGIGTAPALIALIIYSLLPMARNTFVGLTQLDPALIDAGWGMGMSRFQLFRRIEVRLAAPLIMEGVRTASVQAVGLATVAALIGAGGLGWFVFQGIGQAAPDLILLGAIPVIILALVVDAVMRTIIRLTAPKGLGEKQ